MLFIKNIDDIDENDVIAFCKKYDEGLRVEYKSNFGTSVKNKLPKVISSFANSYGGVLILGIRTDKGVAQEPYEGFEKPSREEIKLSIENKCLTNIYPLIIPSVKVIEIKKSNNVFVVIEIQESSNAPHAIENSTKMYVRTGNQSKPYDLADLNEIQTLLKKRNKSDSDETKKRLINRYKIFESILYEKITDKSKPNITITITPLFVHRQISDLQTLYESSKEFKLDNCIPFNIAGNLNRFDMGVYSSWVYNEEKKFIINYCGTNGEIVTHQSLEVKEYDELFITVYSIIKIMANILLFSDFLYKKCKYLGDIELTVDIQNVLNQHLFLHLLGKETTIFIQLKPELVIQ